ncbi:probable tRNA-specific adenosine deaminase 1 [Fusarium torulosum]|uniref:Probable tRNA-specific adenosine deaminase 1 n=1 Tax=Fusarium torulosum TaxID=33205 RepID=A0AAE8SKS5_9HYPO|nr:probable tRNA-specific adenosine deaminase 1 [Fusarium torulosum]
MTSQPDLIAQVVLQQFHKLPPKRKPVVRDNCLHEWVPLSGIVAEKDGVLTCLALATGMKCLPVSKIAQSNGVGIHDWHAEVLAIRAFNRFLVDECQNLLNGEDESSILQRKRHKSNIYGASLQLFEIKHDIKLHMYCSEAPCGDASMELTMAAQKDASAWETPTPISIAPDPNEELSLLGRACFSRTGIVRRKPARGDAPPTLSKSCSDKLALKQCTSLLSSITSLFVDPANVYIHTLILPKSQYSDIACRRSFSAQGRMKPLVGIEWPGGYSFREFSVTTTDLEFQFSKRAVKARADKISASNLAAIWSLSGFEENIIGGVIQGRKAFKTNGASRTSRRSMWEAASNLAGRLDEPYSATAIGLASGTYRDFKEGQLTTHRQQVKDNARETALVGWIRNDGGSDFQLEEHSNH